MKNTVCVLLYAVCVPLYVALSSETYKKQICKLMFHESSWFPGYHSVCHLVGGGGGDGTRRGGLLSVTDALQFPYCKQECLFYLQDANCLAVVFANLCKDKEEEGTRGRKANSNHGVGAVRGVGVICGR